MKIIESCKEVEEDHSQAKLQVKLEKELAEVEQTEDRLSKAIDLYQESFLSVIKPSKNERNIYCNDIIKDQISQDRENFINFLGPANLQKIKQDKI